MCSKFVVARFFNKLIFGLAQVDFVGGKAANATSVTALCCPKAPLQVWGQTLKWLGEA